MTSAGRRNSSQTPQSEVLVGVNGERRRQIEGAEEAETDANGDHDYFAGGEVVDDRLKGKERLEDRLLWVMTGDCCKKVRPPWRRIITGHFFSSAKGEGKTREMKGETPLQCISPL